tara:strand:- start:186 stop:530 length:345 start_codon:yes stop_codon:yes gene_type:complete
MKKVKLSVAALLIAGASYGQSNDTIAFMGQETMEVQRNLNNEVYVMLDNDTIMIPFPYSSMNVQTSPGLNDAAMTGNTEWLIDEDYKAIRIGENKYKIIEGYVADECLTLKKAK